ncbi:MAG: L,D-transpeptidase family protein [Pseudonocardiaceae bacterium]
MAHSALFGRRFLVFAALGGVVVLVLTLVGVALLSPSDSNAGDVEGAPATSGAVPPAPVADVSVLPESTTHTTVDAPSDPGPSVPTDGSVVHPRREVPVFAAPGGPAIARIGSEQVGETWLSVIDEQPGWVQVLLPSRPNGSVGWLPTDGLDRAVTPYLVRVHLQSFKMELFREGALLGKWTIGIGKKSAPTPLGRTFLLGSFSDRKQRYSPVILPLGSHSPTLDTFGGGPGTVAIHTWPTDDVFGTRSSDGCIRVPNDALDQLTEVPLGTLVLVDDQ